ncbi:c-type cytochrome [Propionivibrio sp.]|uniref:c-type cytochrome n=1 Tax=Propionivibrio sp. TaxID=2212460 RepID=UPI0039E389F1
MTIRLTLGAAGVAAMLASAPMAHAVNAEAAQALAKKEGCLKCHALDKRKEAATLKEIAKKYAGKPDAEATILKQITTGVKVKFEDGTEDEHKTVRTKDKAEIDNLIQWILSVK